MEINQLVDNIPTSKEPFKIEYEFVPFHRRALASLIDGILFILLFVGLFIAVRGVLATTENFKHAVTSVNKEKITSGLYIPNNELFSNGNQIKSFLEREDKSTFYNEKDYISLTFVLSNDNLFGAERKIEISTIAIRVFFKYCENTYDNQNYTKIYDDYITCLLNNSKLKDKDGNSFFVDDGEGFLIYNTSCSTSMKEVFEKGYKNYIDERATGWLVSSPSYYSCTKYFMLVFFLLEVPIAFVFSSCLVFLLPTFIFKHGRMTLGKFVYKIAVIDKNLFTPSKKRTLIRFALYFFSELLFSLFSFGAPLIISITMMVVTKKKQSFHDYMLGMYEVDASKNKIFMDDLELKLEDINSYKAAIDFKRKGRL